MLFLIAGFEINVSSLRSRQGYSAIATWVVCFALGMAGAAVITSFSHELNTYIAVGRGVEFHGVGHAVADVEVSRCCRYAGG